MKRIVCFGEILLRLGAPGREPLLRTPLLESSFGGAEANVALSLVGLGQQAAVVSVLPDNCLGEACLGELRRYGVDISGVSRRGGRMGLYFLTRGAMLRPSQIVYDRAHSAFAQADPRTYDWHALLAGADWLHVTGISPAVGTSAERAVSEAMTVAAELDVAISFDCNFRPSLWRGREQEAASVLRTMAGRAQLLFGGVLDIAMLFSADFSAYPRATGFQLAAEATFAAAPALQYLAATDRVVHGAEHHELTGYLADRNGVSVSRTLTLNPIVDRIGGGDAFAAGIIFGLCEGLERQQCADFAVAAAALKHSVPGDFHVARARDVWGLLESAGCDVQR
jgi:2-dehydro-3-deoxygluconokinase